MTTLSADPRSWSPAQLHHGFLALLPRLQLHGQVYFRYLHCPSKKQEALAEMTALAWKWYIRLVRRGKDPARFPCVLAGFAARAVASGRRLCGQEKAKDVLSEQAQLRHSFKVEALPQTTRASVEHLYGLPQGQRQHDDFEERLRDNTQTPPPEQAAFRIDFPAWRKRHTRRDRRLLDDMALGERTQVLARKHRLSAGRVSQLRRHFMEDWRRFCGEAPSCEARAAQQAA